MTARRLLSSLVVSSVIFTASAAYADILCVKKKTSIRNNKAKLSNVFTTTTTTCPRGFVQVVDTSSFTGATGSAGADGSLRIYGDGSGGDKVSTGVETLNDTNLQYSSFTVSAGANLSIASGTVIRSSGACNINGDITLLPGADGGRRESGSSTVGLNQFAASPANIGLAKTAAQSPEVATSSTIVYGGVGGRGVETEFAARQIRYPGPNAAGSGAGLFAKQGGSAGGTLVLLCKEGINIAASAVVSANGIGDPLTGGGGGAGGIIIMASPSSIVNAGTVEANGGVGGNSDSNAAASGGGSGGIIHFLAPSVTAGTRVVNGGAGGQYLITITNTPRSGGAGGGGCGGSGSNGTDVQTSNLSSAASDGDTGRTLTSLVDPTALF